jgi:hypothetical protein
MAVCPSVSPKGAGSLGITSIPIRFGNDPISKKASEVDPLRWDVRRVISVSSFGVNEKRLATCRGT